MPLTPPNLDDWTFAQLIEEGRKTIAAHAPEWTNHNPSDPGITLMELFAYFTEMLIFQTGQLAEPDLWAFYRLLNAPDQARQPGRDVKELLGETVVRLRQPNRAVTCEDYENLALAADQRISRAKCVPRANLEGKNQTQRRAERPGHVSVIIVPARMDGAPPPIRDLIAAVQSFLEPRRLLTTRVHVVEVRYVPVSVRVTIAPMPGISEDRTILLATGAIENYLDPLTGGRDGDGWPFGRSIYTGEIYELLDKQRYVDYITQMTDSGDRKVDELSPLDSALDRVQRNAAGQVTGIKLDVDELPGKPSVAIDVRMPAVRQNREI